MEDADDVKSDIQFIEYFSGCGRITQLADFAGYQSVGFDLEYGKQKARQTGRRNAMDLNSNGGFVLAAKLILRSRLDLLIAVFAICCSSFVPVNRATGSRDILVPEGNEPIVSVRKSNKLLSRNLG